VVVEETNFRMELGRRVCREVRRECKKIKRIDIIRINKDESVLNLYFSNKIITKKGNKI
jgi:hypothetical protein